MKRSEAAVAAAVSAVLLAGAAAAQPPPPPSTADFVKSAASSDRFEILEGRVADVEARDPRVRAFARQMIQEHMKTTQALEQAAARSGAPPPPPGLNGDQQMLLSALQGVTGPDFDRTYLRHQVLGHQAALVVAQGYAADGPNAEIRRTATSTVPVIQHHLDMAKRMSAALGG